MTGLVKAPKDLAAGLIYMAVGLGAVVIARGYAFGSGAEMGPGYFPTILGWILAGIGALAIGRSVLRAGAPVGAIAWKAVGLVAGGNLAFGLLLTRAGLPIALVALALLSAMASQSFRLGWKPLAGLAALVVACTAVFVVALGLPMPLLGSWFGEG